MILLDTDILIDVQRGVAPAVEWFSQLDELPAVPDLQVESPYQRNTSRG